MVTKNDLEKTIADIVTGIRAPSISTSLPFPPHAQKRFVGLLDKCIDLQKELLSVAESDPAILDIQKEVYSLEAEYFRLRSLLQFMPSFILLYVGGAIVFLGIRRIDIPKFITGTLGVDAPERLISFGIAGAFLYLATSMLSRMETIVSARKSQFTAVADFTLRLSLAIVVPIILVALFFTKEGTIRQVKISPELTSFACGYSAKLVVEAFNKIVEKVRKMIEAI